VNGGQLPARRAGESIGELPEKCVLALILDDLQVLEETHPEVLPITLVQMYQPWAWIPRALEAVPDHVIRQQLALFLQKRALFVPRATTGAMGDPSTLSGNLVGIGQVAAAYSAVHPTRGNQFWIWIHWLCLL
jgi:hypothetical protein